MELILAILVAGPAGYFTETRRRGLTIYLVLWGIVFPIQTIVVFSEGGSDNNFFYWVVNAAILCAGIGLGRLGSALRERKLEARAG